MFNTALKEAVFRLLPRVQTPAQYIGGELNSVVKDHRQVRGKLCLAFPDTYTLGMSHHGLQVLYTHHERRPAVGLRAGLHAVARLRGASCASIGLPLYSLETFTPLREFDLIGFSLQYEVCYTNVLTMLDLGGIPLHSKDRTLDHPLVIAGGPGAQNPELLAPFIDLFVIGDGEESLPWLMDKWMTLKERHARRRRQSAVAQDMLAELVGSHDLGLRAAVLRAGVPRRRHASPPCTARAADVPQRGHGLHHQPGLRRHPAADAARRALRARRRTTASPSRSCAAARGSAASANRPSSNGRCASARVETIVQAALESYRNTGHERDSAC